MIKENNSQGYKIAQEGDGVNIASRMKDHYDVEELGKVGIEYGTK